MPTVQKITCRTNEEWRHERAKSVGASAVGTILGLSRFMSPQQLADRMRAELRGEFDFSQTFPMMRGHAYEGGVASLFEWQSGYKVIQASSAEYIVRRSDIPFLHASPDRIYWLDAEGPQHGKLAETNKGVLECKTTRRAVKADALPLPWLLQLQVQMGITGYHHGHLAWDVFSKTEGFGFAEIEYNEVVFNHILEVCHDFWHFAVVRGETPRSASYLETRHPNLYSGCWTQPVATYVEQKNYVRKAVDGSEPVFPFRPLNPIDDELENELIDEQEQTNETSTPDNLSWFERIINRLKK